MHNYIHKLIKHKDDIKLCNIIATAIASEKFEENDVDFNDWNVEDVQESESQSNLREFDIFLRLKNSIVGMEMRVNENCELLGVQFHKFIAKGEC